MSVPTRICVHCSLEMPVSRTNCPHCGLPSFFPNVDLAKTPEERQKLARRVQSSLQRLKEKAAEHIGRSFISACRNSVAVFACTLLKLHREIAATTEIFETYYDLERLRLRAAAPRGTVLDWAKLRPQAEIELLGSHHHIDQIHYACLTLNGQGLDSYGDCAITLSTHMIAHRSSCFEGNTAVRYHQTHSFAEILRSDWDERHLLCLAACEDRLDSSCNVDSFPDILVNILGNAEQDQFVEVHVFGPMTARTFQSVRVNVSKHRRREQVFRKAVQEKLGGVPFEEIRS